MKKAEGPYHFFFHPQVVAPGTLLLTEVGIFITRTVMKQAGGVHTQTGCQHALVGHWLSQWHWQTHQDHSRPGSCDLMSLCTKQMINGWPPDVAWGISFPSKGSWTGDWLWRHRRPHWTNTSWPNHSSVRNGSNPWQVWHTLIPSVKVKLEKERKKGELLL